MWRLHDDALVGINSYYLHDERYKRDYRRNMENGVVSLSESVDNIHMHAASDNVARYVGMKNECGKEPNRVRERNIITDTSPFCFWACNEPSKGHRMK